MLDGTLFVVCLPLNTLFLLFLGILICNCIRRTYLVAVYTLNTPSTAYCSFLTAENVPLTFGVVLWPLFCGILTCNCIKMLKMENLSFMLFFNLENINRIFYLTSKLLNLLRGTLFVLYLLLNTSFLLFFAV